MSDSKVFNAEEKKKLSYLINEGITVMTDVDALNEGLTETVKAIAEEMEIKPSILKKAIRTAYKQSFHQATTDYELLENILESVGKAV